MKRTMDKEKPAFGGVSAVIITYNEEANIRRTLQKLHWCDEIVIVDSYSTDKTVAICREFNCTIFFKEFEGYGVQKRFAVSKASHNWVLCIDADEVLSNELVDEIMQISPADAVASNGFSFRMNLVFLGKEFKHGKESGRYFTRLFNKQKGGFTNDKVHEAIRVDGPVKKLNHIILHYSYSSLHQCLEKNNRYSTYSAEMAFSKGKDKSMLVILLGLPFNFFKYYFLERNMLNGVKGFYWSVFSSYYHFSKHVKLKELRQACRQHATISSTTLSKA
ncbi:glycosyltransferase family 2 protein [Pseudobacter ginsenosidimutans]|uniref:Glycosyltransferase involved in cell wall biosynthesis n=1 Tax=Pseudobacter ginsenosidimutans TaxID=661488 RepID=A0A4V2F235_9BACT|nr:glycosyltransferase family 2 protein [Pseudobacter ginsenosidimutans]QEC44426.1 glycosyltransferase family 2 protein [Pseudobacter ginsenosidimutans]RZS75897.1 glycosyltransferase involved in cell wall biosynthesis [Pseudobacter ginsenosidimutans]